MATFDPSNKGANVTLSNADLTATRAGSPHEAVTSTTAHSSGIRYFEITSDLSENRVGIAGPNASMSVGVGETVDGWGHQSNGFKFTNGAFLSTGLSIANANVVGVIVDLDTKTFSIITPGPVTTQLYTGIDAGDIYAAVSCRNGGTVTANFGASAFVYALPSGAVSWDTASAPTPEITSISPVTATSSSATAVTLTGTTLAAMSQAKWDDGSTVTTSSLTNVTITSADTSVTLVAGTYTLTISDGTTDYLQDETLTVLDPETTAVNPATIQENTATTVTLTGIRLSAQTIAKWDDTVNPVVSTSLINVTSTGADTSVNLPAATYTLTLSDGVNDYLQDEQIISQVLPNFFDPGNKTTGITLTNSDATATNATATWESALGGISHAAGKKYFELVVDSLPVGASAYSLVGVSGVLPPSGDHLGSATATETFAWYNTGGIGLNGAFQGVIGSANYVTSDKLGIAVDLGTGVIDLYINSTQVHSVTLTGYTSLLIAASLRDGAQVTMRPGSTGFTETVPTNYDAWDGTPIIVIPDVTSISPATATSNVATAITLTGVNFSGLTQSKWDDGSTVTTIALTSVAATSADANVSLPTGSYTLTVSDGVTDYLQDETLTVADPINVTSIVPTTGPENTNTIVTLSGTSLQAQTTAKWNDGTNPIISTTLTSVTATSAETTVNLAAGVYTLTLSDGVTDLLQDETFTAQAVAPTVSSISPASGIENTSTTVALAGANMALLTQAKWDDSVNPAVVTALFNVTATSASTNVALPAGSYTLSVSDGATDYLEDEIFTAQVAVPEILSINPINAFSNASTSISISGTTLSTLTLSKWIDGGTTVQTILNNVTSTTADTIVSLASGNYQLTVSDGTIDYAQNETLSVVDPAASSLTPSVAVENTSTTIVIAGTGLTGLTTAKWDDSVSPVISTPLTSVTATSAETSINLSSSSYVLTLSDGVNDYLQDETLVVSPPPDPIAVTGLSPSTVLSGANVTIFFEGTSLTGQTQVIWDDGTNPVTITAITVNTATSASTTVNLIAGIYSLSISDGVTPTPTVLSLIVQDIVFAPKPEFSIPWGVDA